VHEFDIVSADHTIVGEVKKYTWRNGRDELHNKLTGFRRDVGYLNKLPTTVGTRFVALGRSINERSGEHLADFLLRRIGRRKLGVVRVFEVGVADGVRQIA